MKMSECKFVRHWQALLMLAAIPALTNCSRIDGSVELNNSSGEPYSFEGAQVEVFDLNRSVVLPGATKTPKGIGSVKDGGVISAQAITATIEDDALYDVEIQCPTNNVTDACNVESPLHIVLSGAQLKAGGWTATALSDAIFHNVGYYATVEYSVADIQQMLDQYAGILLTSEPAAPAKNYSDVLSWHPVDTDLVKRRSSLNTISDALAQGSNATDIKLRARQWVSPVVTNLSTDVLGLSPGSITVADGYAYLGSYGTGFGVFDIHNPDQPVKTALLDDIHINGPILISGTTAYFRDSSSKIQMVDISNPQQPHAAGNFSLPIIGSLLGIAGDYAYVTDTSFSNYSFQIFNISNAQQPVLTAKISIPTEYGATISGNHLYVATYNTLNIFNISDPAAPVAEATLTILGASSQSQIKVSAGYAYVTTYVSQAGLAVVAISNPAAPTLTSQLTLPERDTLRYEAISQSKIYLATYSSLLLVDASDPAAPVLTRKLKYSVASLAGVDQFVYIASPNDGLSIIDPDTATPTAVLSGSLINDGLPPYSVFTPFGNYAFSSLDGWGFDVFDFTDPVAPVQEPHIYGPTSGSFAIKGNYAIYSDGEFSAIRVADIRDPLHPVDLPHSAIHFAEDEKFGLGSTGFYGNTLFVSKATYIDTGDEDSLSQSDCTNPARDSETGLIMIDITSPEALGVVDSTCLADHANAVSADGNNVYVAVMGGLLQIMEYNAFGLGSPSTVKLSTDANFVAAADGHAWAMEGYNGIEIVDVSNPEAPVIVTKINTHGDAQHVVFDQRYAYVANGASGLLIFDISNPAAPALVASASTRGNAASAFVSGDYLYGVTSYGIEVLKVLPTTSN